MNTPLRVAFISVLPSPYQGDLLAALSQQLRHSRWMFWGEMLGRRSNRHDRLTAPLRKASGIAALGTWAKKDYEQRFPGRIVFHIAYHCSLDGFRSTPSPQNKNDSVTFLFRGQMIARKGLGHLLTAFAELPEHCVENPSRSAAWGATSRAPSANWDPEDGAERCGSALMEVAA